MKKVYNYDIIDLGVRWDIMNNNLLTSTAMLSAYWEKEKKDVLDLMMPFLKYSIGKTTKVGTVIDVSKLVVHFKQEFGYDTMPMGVFTGLLNRLCPNFLNKTKEKYTLKKSLDDEITRFERGHALFEEHRSKVVTALSEYLNQQTFLNRHYTPEATMTALINFFAANGICIIKDTVMLEALRRNEDHQQYYIAQFIIDEYNKKTEVFSYIEDMVKGFFVSTALTIQPQNTDVARSKAQDLSCFLDTRLVINALGFCLPEERTSALEVLKMLTEKGAKLFCFEHNVQEIISIMSAYKYALNNPYGSNSPHTLIAWDEQHYTVSDVERQISLLRTKISHLGITIREKPPVIDAESYPFNDDDFLGCINEKIHYTKREALERDVQSIASIFLLRAGYRNSEIEKSKYIFITSNILLASVANAYLIKKGICDFGEETMPIITDIDMSSIVWLKCYSSHKDFPKQKLIEQSLIALEPTPTMMTTFFEMVDRLAFEGGITADEAAILRADVYCKRELASLARGNAESINEETVYTIREKLRTQYVGDANRSSDLNYQKYVEQKNENRRIITSALSEVEAIGKSVFESTQKRLKIGAWIIFVGLCILLLMATLYSLDATVVCVSTGVLSIVSFIGVIDMMLAKKSKIYHIVDCIAHRCADRVKDRKKDEYEKIFGSALRVDIEL